MTAVSRGMPALSDAESWAYETFATVDLGDARRTRRLDAVAAALARSPAGAVAAAVQAPAGREAAFRFLASEQFDVCDLGDGITDATLRRCSGTTFCAVDSASISLSDEARSRDVGGVGSWRNRGRGLHAITMVAAGDNGAPVGILGPQWWARTERTPPGSYRSHRSLQTETRFVVHALQRVEDRRRALGVDTKLWFQLDRGFDAWPVFQLARDLGLLMTVRSATDRKVRTRRGSGYLRATARRAPRLGIFTVRVPERADRPARTATLALRSTEVNLQLPVGGTRAESAPVTVVYAEEERYLGPDRLRWILLTTAKVTKLAEAYAVVLGYTTRWLIEDLHRAWKRGWMNVEKTQLRRRNSLCKWATIHLALAARALRLARLARSEPHRASTDEFTQTEIHAILLLRTRAKPGERPPPSLSEIVLLLAELGGYDRYSKKPAGATVIGRGLERIASLAQGLELLGDTKK